MESKLTQEDIHSKINGLRLTLEDKIGWGYRVIVQNAHDKQSKAAFLFRIVDNGNNICNTFEVRVSHADVFWWLEPTQGFGF